MDDFAVVPLGISLECSPHAVTVILEIDGATRAVKAYSGAYSAYAAAKQHELREQWERYQRLATRVLELRDGTLRELTFEQSTGQNRSISQADRHLAQAMAGPQ